MPRKATTHAIQCQANCDSLIAAKPHTASTLLRLCYNPRTSVARSICVLTDFRVRQREYLLQISRALSAQLELSSVLRLILEAAGDLLSGHAGLIVLRSEEAEPGSAGAYVVRASFGIPPPMLSRFAPLWADDGDGVSRMSSRQLAQIALVTGMTLRQVVALPMSVGDQTL